MSSIEELPVLTAFVPRPSVSLVIPAMNEAENLPWLMKRLPAGLHEVILVDGASTDGTAEVARRARPDVRVIAQSRRGKGNAVACGLAAATGDIIVMMDADGSSDPMEIERFVAAFMTTPAQVVKGSRYVPGGGSGDLTTIRSLGNRMLRSLANVLWGTCYTDLCYGFMAFDRSCLGAFDLEATSARAVSTTRLPLGDGFEIESLLALRAARRGLEVIEVPSFELPRGFGQSHLRTFRDGWRVLRLIVHERLGRRLPPAVAVPLPTPQECPV